MSLSNLTKQQKQYLSAGVVVVLIVAILAALGIKVSLSSIGKAKAELATLSQQIDQADGALSRRNQISEDYERTVSILKSHLKNVPPDVNYYSWATETIYSAGRNSNLEIDSVDEVSSIGKAGGDENAAIKFELYSLRIVARGTYKQIKTFIQNVEQKHPLLRFTGLDITAGTNPDSHNVQLYVQWPFKLGAIAKNWADIEAKQHMIAKRDALKPAVSGADVPKEKIEPKPATVKPEVVKPEPVIAKVVPEPKPVVKPEPVKVTPEVVKPAPVIAKVVPEPKTEQVQLSSLLASLESHGSEQKKPSAEPVANPEDLEAYVKQLNEAKESVPEVAPPKVEEKPAEPTYRLKPDQAVEYVSTVKSAKKIAELLSKEKPKESASLGSFLNGMVEGINE